ncbi:amidohydrolase [Nocardioides lentus]|uniref:amidohydrolase n=1 Tax=Nocardioides lentus TaxID=338077 RepID=UPI0031D257A0
MADSSAVPNAYLDVLAAQTARRAATARPLDSAYAGAPEAAHAALAGHVDGLGDDLVALATDLHDHPELAFAEVRSAGAVAGLLRRHGLAAEVGVHGLATAVRAEVVTPGFDPARHRTVAVLAEYDALPGLGHACGHNVIAATAVGAVLGLRATLPAAGVEGRVVLLGCPAEEGHTGKEYLARAGALDGLDAAVMVHPYGADVADQVWLGRRVLSATWTGASAHASASPFAGRNALDAASLAYQGIGLLRQQTPPVDRVHAVIVDGGDRASVIPSRARMDLYVRSPFPETLADLSRRVDDVLHGAARMAGVEVDVAWDTHPPSLPVRANGPLTGRWSVAQQRRGRSPYPPGVVSETFAASTDFGNVSYRLPGIHPLIGIADLDAALHTVEFAAASRSPAAARAAVDGAYGLAAVALDLLADDELAAAVREDFEAAGGALDVAGFFG